ncbi:MAG: flagellar motor switch protein FliN [Alphaproteobacteria bacterium]|nr:flagellar motor switch protein FliN [Alphaproteobacteria bacterium]MCA3569247.1 flagellar motor switch protein FliN [Bradyrhizobium sp.]
MTDLSPIGDNELTPAPLAGDAPVLGLDALLDVPVKVRAVLGRTTMDVGRLSRMRQGEIVELDRRIGELVDVYVNDRLVARGELVLVDDQLGVSMTEIVKSPRV